MRAPESGRQGFMQLHRASSCGAILATLVLSTPPASAEPPASGAAAFDDGPSGLVIGGATTLAVFYANCLLLGLEAGKDHEQAQYATIPLAGPFVAAATLDDSGFGTDDALRVVFTVAGVGQLVGAAILFGGFADSESDTAVSVAPAPGADAGLGLAARF